MATHSSTLAWKIPWTEEPDRLQSMGSLRVGHNWATSLSLSCIGEGNGNPLQYSCLENPRDRWAWWAAVYGVTQSRTRLKRLSSSSSSNVTGAISLLFSISMLGTYWPTEFIFQCHISLPFHTVHGVLKARTLKWFVLPLSRGQCFVRSLHHDLPFLGGTTWHGS